MSSGLQAPNRNRQRGQRNLSENDALPPRQILGRSFFMVIQGRTADNEIDKAAGTIDDIQHDLQVVRDDLSRLAQQVASLLSVTGSQALREVKAQMTRAKQSLDGVLSDAGEKGLEAMDTMREGTDTLLESIEETVRQRPLATLAVAMGLGFLFGVTWRR